MAETCACGNPATAEQPIGPVCQTCYDLVEAGANFRYYDEARKSASVVMYGAIRAYIANGGTEVCAAKVAGVDRMTVRRALGKRQ
jgi:hypothetical protein